MKGSIILITLACAAVFVSAEPPVGNYLPPSQQQPSNQYGPPSFGGGAQGFQKPASQYGPPSNSYIPPQNNYQPQPSNSYGVPAQTQAVFKPQPQYGAPSGSGGYGGGYENNEPARYNFEYNVQDYPSGNDFGHMEQRDGDKTVGRYYVLLPDGRKQIVNYEADQNGYRPTITYEETNSGGYKGGNNNNNNQFNGY